MRFLDSLRKSGELFDSLGRVYDQERVDFQAQSFPVDTLREALHATARAVAAHRQAEVPNLANVAADPKLEAMGQYLGFLQSVLAVHAETNPQPLSYDDLRQATQELWAGTTWGPDGNNAIPIELQAAVDQTFAETVSLTGYRLAA